MGRLRHLNGLGPTPSGPRPFVYRALFNLAANRAWVGVPGFSSSLFVVYYLQKRALGGETADFERPAAINKLPQGCALLASGEWGGAGMLGRSCPNADMKRRQFIKFIGSVAAMGPLPLPMAWRFAASAQDPAGVAQGGVRQVAQPGQATEIG